MPSFLYIARDEQGHRVTGTLSAGSRHEAAAALSARELFPLKVDEQRGTSFRRTRRVGAQRVATTYGQLAALLRSGVPLLRAIDVIRRQSNHAGLVQILEDVRQQVENGASLADALARHPRAFGPMATNILRAGGEGGFLEDALDRVAQFTEQQDDLKSRIAGVLAYPAFLAVVGTVIVCVLVIFFVPRFEDLFSQLRDQGELPLMTEWLLGLSKGLQHWGWLLAIGLIAVVLVVRARLATDAGRRMLDGLRMRLPWAGTIYLNLAVARFCRVLGTLLRGGVPILRSLQISSQATGNQVLAEAIERAAENISEGESLSRPLADCGHFPPTVIEMISVGEESNTLEAVLGNIADTLERQTWRRLDLFVRLLEPVMLLLLASVVLAIVIALLLPVMKMSMTM